MNCPFVFAASREVDLSTKVARIGVVREARHCEKKDHAWAAYRVIK
jgi:hypothetical protein